VVLEREDIDFGEVSNGQEAIEEFNVKNPGKFCISYKAYIVAGSVSMEIVNPQGAGPDPMQELDLFYTSSDTGMYQQQQQALQLGVRHTKFFSVESAQLKWKSSCQNPFPSFYPGQDGTPFRRKRGGHVFGIPGEF